MMEMSLSILERQDISADFHIKIYFHKSELKIFGKNDCQSQYEQWKVPELIEKWEK